MGRITLSGAMPAEPGNGLAPFSDLFLQNETVAVPVVCMVAVSKVTRKVAEDEEYPTLQILHWELVQDESAIKAHGEMLGAALGKRTGAMQLPFAAGSEVPGKNPFPAEEE